MQTMSGCSVLSSGRLPRSLRGVTCPRQRPCRRLCVPRAALEIDFSDSDTWVGIAGAVLGVGLGIGAPVFYAMRDEIDEKRLEELRELNRKTFKETGEYLTEEEIAKIRVPRWTDRREFADDD
eukprot:jgi/Botrbrau1/20808/Bobra.0156s0037.1